MIHKLATFPHTMYGLGAKMSHIKEAQKNTDIIVTRVTIVSPRSLFLETVIAETRER